MHALRYRRRQVLGFKKIALTEFLNNKKHFLRSNTIVDSLKVSYHYPHRSLVIPSSILRLWRQVHSNSTDL